MFAPPFASFLTFSFPILSLFLLFPLPRSRPLKSIYKTSVVPLSFPHLSRGRGLRPQTYFGVFSAQGTREDVAANAIVFLLEKNCSKCGLFSELYVTFLKKINTQNTPSYGFEDSSEARNTKSICKRSTNLSSYVSDIQSAVTATFMFHTVVQRGFWEAAKYCVLQIILCSFQQWKKIKIG